MTLAVQELVELNRRVAIGLVRRLDGVVRRVPRTEPREPTAARSWQPDVGESALARRHRQAADRYFL